VRLNFVFFTDSVSELYGQRMYIFDNWGKYLIHKKMQCSYSEERFTVRAKPIQIIGDQDNHLPD
jgi:hypothetical protein